MDTQSNRQLLAKLARDIPQHLFGEARLQVISEHLEEQADETKIALKNHLDSFLERMKKLDASDIDFGGPGCADQIWFRVYGIKRPEKDLDRYSLTETDILINNLLTKSELQQLFKNRYLDISYRTYHENTDSWTRFRATIYFELNHLALNMRRINEHIVPFSKYGFNEAVAKALSLKYQKSGLILITGITGSGKSTTLDSIIEANNRTMQAHIIIISDPVEYVHLSQKSVVKHREIGRDVHSFKDGTIQALRQDPDIIVIGEMRDAETIMTVLEVVDSGHKVFTTLHTSSAVESIDRILGEIPPEEQNRIRERLADVLSCVISQKLVPSVDGKRVLAKEIMLTNASIKTAIRNNNVGEIYQIIHQSREQGMMTMEQDLAYLYSNNVISYFEAYINANNKKRFEDLVKYNY
ncbi:MAG: ATPase, T2SS/T4P/T4SS family [bacterium]